MKLLKKILLYLAPIFVGGFLLNMVSFDENYEQIEHEFLVLINPIDSKEPGNYYDIIEVHDRVKIVDRDSNGNIRDLHLDGYD